MPETPDFSGPGYLITADAGDVRVEAWSSTRLPFEPTGAMLQFRAGLRTAVGRLSADVSRGLSAIYTSPVDGRFDIENVLLYYED